MKSILVISRSFYPDNSPRAFRTTELVKEFSRQGHNVILLTTKLSPSQQKYADDINIEIKSMGVISWPTINIVGRGLFLYIKRALRRILQLSISYPELQYMFMINKALKNIKGFDLLISIAVPYSVHWGVALRRNKKNKIAKVWIADCGDPFMGQENDTFKYPFYFKYVEKWFMKKTDFVSVPTVGAISAYYPEFKDKIKVIPQGFDFNFYFKTEDKHNDNVPTFGYAGTLIRGRRDPKEFIAYILSLKTDFIFYVYTKNTDLIEPFLQQSKGRVILKSLVPREKLLQELSQLDFVVNFENVGNKQTPSKLIDYVIINKPILSIKTGNLNIDIINEFLAGNYNNKFIVNNHDQYRIENVCKQFLNLVKD